MPYFCTAISILLLTLPAMADDAFRGLVESDWLLQEQYRTVKTAREVTTQSDAKGACDGIKDGRWGFHTNLEENPWWQVDLGQALPLSRALVWNRCDAADRNARLILSLSDDGVQWRTAYTHDGTVFYGFTDNKPLIIDLANQAARFIRLQLPGTQYLHLDEVEVFGPATDENAGEDACATKNLALQCPADQSSVSPWSADHQPPAPVAWAEWTQRSLEHARRLVDERAALGTPSEISNLKSQIPATLGTPSPSSAEAIDRIAARIETTAPENVTQDLYIQARWIERRLALANPLIDFNTILFVKRVPGSFNHMSDQYYGWWSRPGGGICTLRNFTGDSPTVECVTDSFTEPGSFLRPTLSYDGTRILFAWCRYYPNLAAEPDKLDKAKVPEDAFYHVFEMNVDGTNVRQLTRGKYDDFDARYLPDGRIVFLSTRRGQFIQCGRDSAALTIAQENLPDCYVRCGGGPERPVAVYTLHTMNADGTGLCAISPFEMFEWTPAVGRDGTILYSRWDYIDRHNMPYMSLWSIHPDGTHSRIVYGNFTPAPHCTFEPQSIPNSDKIVFTASAHHAQTMGSLVLLDPSVGSEGAEPITRLTPEVCFPEIEGWPTSNFANPWPLSERLYLASWGCEKSVVQGQTMAANGMGLYLFDAKGGMELLYRDPDIGCECPIPLQPREAPPVIPNSADWEGAKEGRFVLTDVYRGLKTVPRGDIKALRIVAIPAKTQPTMNTPSLGLTRDDPGKCVLGTVPVDADGSAYFRVPSGVTLFIQALDARGVAIQTMRGATHVQPGQTLSCAGCHEPRHSAPSPKRVMAATREPSKITVGPEGSWPLRFDRLIQPVLDQHCVRCHNPKGEQEQAAKFDLTPENAYASLCNYGQPSLAQHVAARYIEGRSTAGAGAAATSAVLAKITAPEGHHDIKLDPESIDRLVTWMDTYAQRLGSFCDEQEVQLTQLREVSRDLLIERPKDPAVAGQLAKSEGNP